MQIGISRSTLPTIYEDRPFTKLIKLNTTDRAQNNFYFLFSKKKNLHAEVSSQAT